MNGNDPPSVSCNLPSTLVPVRERLVKPEGLLFITVETVITDGVITITSAIYNELWALRSGLGDNADNNKSTL